MVAANPKASYMTAKGLILIPARLRRKYGLKEGTRVAFTEEADRLSILPVTKDYISSFRGVFKLKPGEKSAVQEHLDDRAKERAREDREIAADRKK